MATKIYTVNASPPAESSGSDVNKGAALTAAEFDQTIINLRAAIDRVSTVQAVTTETTLSDAAIVFVTPADGATVAIHLPTYANVSDEKQYRIKNTGQGIVTLNAADSKTIDGDSSITLNPGDKINVCKDASNWQTI